MTIHFDAGDWVMHAWWESTPHYGALGYHYARGLNVSPHIIHRGELHITFTGGHDDMPYPRVEFSSRSVGR